jgi:hypothetical protein
MAETTTETAAPPPAAGPNSGDEAVEKIERWTHRAADVARATAQRVPAAVVVVVGGAVLLAADAFGIGEVVTAGVAGYAAYRILRRRAKKRGQRRLEEAGGAPSRAAEDDR